MAINKKDDELPELSAVTPGAPMEYNRNVGQHLQGLDTEQYHDGLDDWDGERENHQKEGPHFTPWERDQIEKGPEPDPDDGIHMDENEYEGWDPSRQEWVPIHTQAPNPSDPDDRSNFYDRFGPPMGLGGPKEEPKSEIDLSKELEIYDMKADDIPDDTTRTVVTSEQAQFIQDQRKELAGLLDEDDEEHPATWGLMKLAFHSNDMMLAGDALSAEMANAITIPGYNEPDPNFNPEDHLQEFAHLPQNMRRKFEEATNQMQFDEAKRRQAIQDEINAQWDKSSTMQWLMGGAVAMVVEGGLATAAGLGMGGLAGGAVGAATAASTRVAKAVAWANRLKYASVIKNTRYIGARNTALSGAAGGLAEGAFVYSQGVIDAQDAALYPIMGGAVGGALGYIAPHMIGRVPRIAKDADPVMANIEMQEAAAAHIHHTMMKEHGGEIELGGGHAADFEMTADEALIRQRFRRDNPGLDPDDYNINPDGTAEPKIDFGVDAGDAEIRPRNIIMEEDAVMRIRDNDADNEIATTMFEPDRKILNNAFDDKPISPTQAKGLGDAYDRQGYSNPSTRTIYVINDATAHQVAQASGRQLRKAFTDPELAAAAAKGKTVTPVTLPKGSKIVEAGDLGDDIGAKGEILIGDGKLHKGADGKWAFRPKKDLSKGRPSILRARYADGKVLSLPQLVRFNKLMHTLDPDISYDQIMAHGSGVGADAILEAKRYNLKHDQAGREALENPDAGLKKGVSWLQYLFGENWRGVTIAGVLETAENPDARNLMPDLLGGTNVFRRADRNVDRTAVGGSDLSGILTQQHYTLVGEIEQELMVDWAAEMKAKGLPMEKNWIERNNQMEEMLDRYRSAMYNGYEVPADIKDFKSLKVASDKMDKIYAENLANSQDPSHLVGLPPGTLSAVAGSLGIPHRPGYSPFSIDTSKLGKKEAQHKTSGILSRMYQSVLYTHAADFGADVTPEDFIDLATDIASAHIMSKHGVSFEGIPIGKGNTGEYVEHMLRHAGVADEDLIMRIRKKFKVFDDLSIGPERNYMRRFRVNPEHKFRIRQDPLPGQRSQPAGYFEVSFNEIKNTNQFNNMRNYLKHHNGLVAMATVPVRDVDGKPRMHSTPKLDRQTGEVILGPDKEPVMELKPLMYNSKAQINNTLERVRKYYLEKDPTGKVGKRVIEALEESFNTVLNESKFNPSVWTQIGLDVASTATMGRGHESSILDAPMVLGRLGPKYGGDAFLRRIAKLPKSAMKVAEFMRKQKYNTTEDHAGVQWLMDTTGLGRQSARARDASTHAWNSARHTKQYANPGTLVAARIAFLARRASELTHRTALIPATDFMNKAAMEGNMEYLKDLAFKYKKAEDIPYNELKQLHMLRVTNKHINEFMDMFRSDAFEYEDTWAGGKRIKAVHDGKIDPGVARRFQMMMNAGITQKYVMQNSTGSRIMGMDKGYWPIAMQLLGFSMSSMTQLTRNFALSAAEAGKDIATGTGGGRYQGAVSMVKLVGLLGSSIIGGAMVEMVRQERRMASWDEKDKAPWRAKYTDPNWILMTGIEKGGILAIIPTFYDMLLAPAANAPNWAGHTDYQSKRTGVHGVLENFIYGNPLMSKLDSLGQTAGNFAQLARGDIDQRRVRDAIVLTNHWMIHDALTIIMTGMGVDPGKPTEPKNKAPVGNLIESAGKNWAPKRTQKEFSKTYDYWFGDD